MARQFEKFVKILGGGSKPDRAVGTWTGKEPEGGPAGTPVQMTVPVGAPEDFIKDPNAGGKDTNITKAAVNVARGRRANTRARAVEANIDEASKDIYARRRKNLSTTTMRFDETTGEAYDTEDVKPVPSGRVMPTRQANPKYLAADAQRANEDLAAATERDRRMSGVIQSDEKIAENAFNESEKSKGSNIRSINGVTYDMSEWKASGPKGLKDNKPERPNASELQGAVWAGSQAEAKAKANFKEFTPPSGKVSDYKPTKSAGEKAAEVLTATPQPGVTEGPNKSDDPLDYNKSKDPKIKGNEPVFKKVDKITARKGGKIYGEMVLDNIEKESEGPTTVKYGETLSKANTSGTTPYNEDGTVKAEYDDPNTIYSTTMHEHNGEIVEGGVHKAPYKKPEVKKTGNVIPQVILDTYTGSDADVDTTQAALENKIARENRTNLTQTGPYDPNKTPGRDTFGRTPERRAVQGAIREQRAADLASQGKVMTTVAPHIMQSAVALAKSSRFNITDDNYLSSTSFLDHPAVQEATIAHAFNIHHDFSILHKALGGRAPEIARRREAWFKVADRKLRGNPEKIPGEFAVLEATIRKGKPPTTVTRKLEQGKKPGITINGQTPTLAPPAPIADVVTPTRASDRRMHANTAANIMYQQQQAAKEAHNIMTFTPLKTTTMRLNEVTGEAYDSDNPEELLKNTAQSTGAKAAGPAPAGSDMVTVSNKNTPNVAPVTRPFTKAEKLNKGNVPSADDSKRRV